ncbi:restriction endonuclease subunit S [Geobacillus sp. FSL K6-0789]|uniref:Restriction endonuclease subunit S n=1 Tax=Geobacillus stearothermophilus TaxID=1422 RepID=A0A3L7CNV2_GEOSE|nr:restriction endonuclease subunit S [Geobacillus stearothermophilus]RLQ05713.1 restriction endonuclease subunit S [Geobacillus stearothermophilus]RLQ06555.1 restriction endonuclease subunit S [Geobacillus stearothermophilus]RLQ13003.1 restriction endonuclease subunit S [Geobacillus stearothermophilus]
MKGRVEFSIVKLSEIDNIKGRLDAEYYKRSYLKLEEKINAIGKIKIKDINVELDCSAFYPSITEYYNFDFEGVPFLRVNDIQNGLVTINSETAFLPQFVLDNNPSTIAIAYPGDIVIAKGGNTLAKLGLVTNEYPYYALSRDLILLRTKNIKQINKYFLWAFLHSKYGQDLLWRTASQTGQPHLTLPSIGEIGLPRFMDDFENKFESLYKLSIKYKDRSVKAYQEAENYLLKAIGLKGLKLSEENINIKNFKESFLATGRLDAEYYQPKYEDYINLIYKYTNGYDLLGSVCNIKDKNFNPEDNIEYKYIELSNIGKSGEITGCTIAKGNELPTRARRKVNENDVIISSIEGSLESCALIPKEYDNALCSTGFYVINSKKINSETLLILFKSELMQNILKQNCSGTILTAINKNEFLNIPVPIIDKNAQEIIRLKITESFNLRKQSENLLEIVKRAVEIAIEQDEKVAIEYIDMYLSI